MPYRDVDFAKPVSITTLKVKLPWWRFGRPYKEKLSTIVGFPTPGRLGLEHGIEHGIHQEIFEIEFCRKWEISHNEVRTYQYQLMDGSFLFVVSEVRLDGEGTEHQGWKIVWRGPDFGKPEATTIFGCDRHFRIGLKPNPEDFSKFEIKHAVVDVAPGIKNQIIHCSHQLTKLNPLTANDVCEDVFEDVCEDGSFPYQEETRRRRALRPRRPRSDAYERIADRLDRACLARLLSGKKYSDW